MGRELKTQLGKAYAQCKKEGDHYGACMEAGLEGRGFGHNSCSKEFDLLRRCIKKQYHPLYDDTNPWSRK